MLAFGYLEDYGKNWEDFRNGSRLLGKTCISAVSHEFKAILSGALKLQVSITGLVKILVEEKCFKVINYLQLSRGVG